MVVLFVAVLDILNVLFLSVACNFVGKSVAFDLVGILVMEVNMME